jgi:hypothetical protein
MRFGLRSGLGAAAAVALLCSGPANAADITIPGKIHIIKEAKLTKMVSKPVVLHPIPAPGGAADPTITGGSVSVFDTVGGDGLSSSLPSGQWTGLGSPAGSKGYKYKGAGTIGDPCKVVLVKEKVIKFVCKDDQDLNPPLDGESGIILSLGADNYCTEFGGTTIKNQAGLLKRKDAPAPGGCSVVATTSSTTSSTSSTTSSTAPAPCCNGDDFLAFSTVDAPGDCGDIQVNNGMPYINNPDVTCAGLFTGGGGNSVPLPLAIPDMGEAVSSITSCTGQTATIGAATSTQTGSNLNCTSPGCFFGAPLAVPNPGSSPTSVCVVNAVASPGPSGSADCSTGATTLSLPLSSVIYLTGDFATDPADTIAGVQPCPLCSAGTCIGGTNNGMGCTAGTGPLNSAYPTSHDCPPDPMFDIGTLPIGLNLTSGTVSWSGVTSSGMDRVFSGFCRDADGTSAFENPANPCLENGMVLNTCTGTFEACQQRNPGAFGPNGGNVRTITAIGNSASILGGPAFGTLVSIFSTPPTFDATVDAAGDLPGPGAVAIPGTAQTCADAMACP